MKNNPQPVEIYGVYVEALVASEGKRQSMNSVYSSLLIAGGALLGAIDKLDPLYIFVPLLLISVVWCLNLNQFRDLAKVKFKVLFELEEKLEFAPFTKEWELFRKSNFRRFSNIELALPVTATIVSLLYIGYRILQRFF